jgi:hypothetical protein
MNASFELPVPFDILDAATIDCLPGYAPGFVDFTREVITPALIVFKMRQRDLGELGTIDLRKLSDKVTQLFIPEARRPTEEDTLKVAEQQRISGGKKLTQKAIDKLLRRITLLRHASWF